MHKLKIKIPVYQCSIHVIISDDIEKVINSYVKKNKWDSSYLIKDKEEVHGYAVSTGDISNYYIFYSVQSLTSNFITHEISHVIDYMLEERDIETVGENRAYLTGYISEKIFDFVIKKHLLISKWLKFIQKENLEKKEKQEQIQQQMMEKLEENEERASNQ